VSLCLHTGMLMWGLGGRATPRLPATTLEIVLVNAHTDATPVQPQLLAQVAIDAGGEAAAGHATSPLPHTGQPDWLQAALHQRQMQLEAEQRDLLTQLRAHYATAQPRELSLSWDHPGATGRDAHDQESVLHNAQIAALAERVHAYNSQPRKHFFAPSTSPVRYAQYVDRWRSIIEAVGTRYYPPEARGRIYGWLRLTVTVRADGSVADIAIDTPSPHALLNQAARRIVQLAAPFPPFTPDMAQAIDELSITRTWHFVNDTLDTQNSLPTP